MKKTPRLLFLCKHNAARSQMAAGFVHAMAGDRFAALGASTEPTPVDPLAIAAMKETGIDISHQPAETVSELFKIHFAYVIAMCEESKERCPIFPFTFHLLRWDVEDPNQTDGPESERLAAFRRVRSVIEKDVKQFLYSVQPGTTLNARQRVNS